MKKLLLSFALLFVTGIFVNEVKAQIRPTFGIRGGVNFASFNDSKQAVDSRRIGLLAGLYAVVNIPGTPVSIQPEVFYSQKGVEINNVEVLLNYLEIPLLVRIDFAEMAALSPHIYAGPYLAFNLNYEEEPAGNLPNTKNIVFGALVGLGIDLNKINFGIRYSLGLEEIFENEEARNTAISIVAGVSF